MRLSFCIPTFNFGPFIGATLDSIARQATDDVEVVVVDGASNDDTADVVGRFAGRLPRLVFHRCETNGGVDRDLARAVDLATGDHCWLFSGDDVLEDGAVERVLRLLTPSEDIVLLNRTLATSNLTPVRPQQWLASSTPDRAFELGARADALAYFAAARSIGALFSYISSIVFRRSLWPSNGLTSPAIGTHFAHAHHLLAAARAGARLRYVRRPEVVCRGDNDSFLAGGSLRRFLIDVDGYDFIARAVFGDDRGLERAFRAVFRREHPWYRLAGPLSRAAAADEQQDLQRRLANFGYRPAQLALATWAASSPQLVGVARAARRRWLRRRVPG